MKQGSRIILTAIAAAALGATATAFAHGGDRAGGGMHGAEGCPMRAEGGQAKREGEHGMGHGRMAQRMRHGMAHDAAKSEAKPETDETHKH